MILCHYRMQTWDQNILIKDVNPIITAEILYILELLSIFKIPPPDISFSYNKIKHGP